MKQLIGHDVGAYAFDKVAQTVTISGVSLTQEQILLVTDSTNGTTIYQFNGGATLGGSYVAGTGVLTLDFNTNTGSFSNTDKLLVYADVPSVSNGVSGLAATGNYGTQNTSAAAWTSATANNTAVTLVSNLTGYSTILVTLNQAPSGTLTSGGCFFEISNDNSNWLGVEGMNPNTLATVGPTFAFTVATYNAFLFQITAPYFRVRLNPVIGGTGTVTIGYAVQSLPQMQAVVGNMALTGSLPPGVAVIGHVIADTGSTTVVTGNVTVVQPTGTNLHAVMDSGSTTVVTGNVTVVQATGTNLHAVIDSGSTTAVTQATGTNLHMVVDSGTITTLSTLTTITNAVTVVGAAASGAAKSGNPLQIGGVFNTTQPTVTNGQAVEAQSTARGAQIVSTGVDTFNVTVNTPLPSGTNVIGHVINDASTAVIGHVIVDSGAIAATLNAETTKVIGTIRNTGNLGAAFDAATNAAPPANAVQVGYVAATALPSAFTATDLVPGMTDKFGRQVVVANTVRDLVGTASVNASAASGTSLVASGGAGVFTDIISLIITNETSTATIVSVTDGTVTYKYALAGNGGIVINFQTPLPATSSATAWTCGNSATVACDYVVVYAKNK